MSYTNGLDKPSDYFNTVLYTGNGTTGHAITGVGFQPQMLWIKGRTNVFDHRLADIVRGTPNLLYPNIADAETADANNISSIDSDGFSLGTGNAVNQSSQTFVSWNWLANGTGVSNTDGSITSTVSANTTSGFSIVSYTGNATNGATVGHGLNSAPQMVITKNRGGSGDWQVLTNIYPNYSEGDYIYLSATQAKANSVNVSFLPTSTTWQMKSGQAGNVASTQIAYCFHSVKGFSKFGSYTGNGNADGTFVYTGFKPAFILRKRTSSTGSWLMQDNKRPGSNRTVVNSLPTDNNVLYSNTSDAELFNNELDILSNGFKLRADDSFGNSSGNTYIYMAFAENPFVTSTGIPTTAR